MSGLDPLAALAAQTALTQAQVQALDLGVAVEILQQQLSVGDLLTATVLPSQGGIDLLSIFGATVAAQLPTGVNPGQSLLLQVTGFSDNQILVQNLGIVDPENPPNTVSVALPTVPEGAPSQAIVTTVLPAATQPPVAAPPAAPPAATPGSVAPPRAVFVAASIAPSAASRAAAAQEPAAPLAAQAGSTPASPPAAVQATPAPPAAPIAQPGTPAPPAAPLAAEDVAAQVAQLGLEARIAATRAASIDIAELVRPAAGDARPPTPAPVPLQGPARTPVPTAPPLLTARPQPPVPPPVPMSARPLVAPSPEAALLERLRIPLAPLTLAAAKIAGSAGTALPRALARLETLLAGVASQDGRAASLRTLLNFAGRLDPSNARALPEQLAAFVNNFVGGPESKLATMIRAFLEAEAPVAEDAANAPPALPGAPANASPFASTAPSATAPSPAHALADASVARAPENAPPAPAAQNAQAAVDPSVSARVAERTAALQYDAKAVVAAMLEAPPRGAAPELVAALNDTLTAITAMQINVLNAQNVNPNTIAIPLPVFFRDQGAPVQMHVSKDAPNGGKLDADNFSIAFVLDTKSLGTVAIDVQTAGRTVSISVKTEGVPAASRFRSTLDDLRGRLQQLRYNVANMTAAVAPHRVTPDGQTPAKPGVETAPEARTSSVLDMRA
ncbi:MAG TPA: hypothetical protein VK760_09625 [Candidatus Acidoferrales bacterium]|nr:hypothetical protein [Candidatus Acidoferrales bacterium]